MGRYSFQYMAKKVIIYTVHNYSGKMQSFLGILKATDFEMLMTDKVTYDDLGLRSPHSDWLPLICIKFSISQLFDSVLPFALLHHQSHNPLRKQACHQAPIESELEKPSPCRVTK